MMKRTILAIAMAALAIGLGVELEAEQLFTAKLQAEEMAPVMADVSEPMAEPAAEPMARTVEQTAPPEIYAVFGVDTAEGDVGRSDCILLLSLEDGVLRMCSLARDTMVAIPGTGEETKLGHAYAYGGPELALAALKENFGVEISQYATVNFSQLPQIVDLMGGAEVTLTREEWNYLGLGEPYLGRKRLSGDQALAYCRIRSIDNDDMRTARQRTLVTAMVSAAQKCPWSRLPALVVEGVGMCRTNVRLPEAVRLAREVLSCKGHLRVEELSIPGDAVSAWGGIRDDGVWYYVYDLGQASEVLSEFFRGEQAQAVAGAR